MASFFCALAQQLYEADILQKKLKHIRLNVVVTRNIQAAAWKLFLQEVVQATSWD